MAAQIISDYDVTTQHHSKIMIGYMQPVRVT
jgi:hypothetical protein